MTNATFVDWVAPHAASYRAVRAEAVTLALAATQEDLVHGTGDTGWTVLDEIVHLAIADEDFIRVLTTVIEGQVLDTSIFGDIDSRNAENLLKGRNRPIPELATALKHNSVTLVELLSRLNASDEFRQPEGFPFTLGKLVAAYGMHAPYHVAQLKDALGRA